jgi:hypothetical protein
MPFAGCGAVRIPINLLSHASSSTLSQLINPLKPSSTTSSTMVAVAPNLTIPTTVVWEYNKRKMQDIFFAILYLGNIAYFLIVGVMYASNSRGEKYIYDTNDGESDWNTFRRNPEYEEDFVECCAGISDSDYVLGFNCENQNAGSARRLTQEASTKIMDSDGMFDAFAKVPHIPTTLIAMAFAISVIWVALLRQFARPIVFATECVKVVTLVWIGASSESAFFYVVAVVYLLLVLWQRERLKFAATIISHAAKGLQDNGPMFVALIAVKVVFCIHCFLFMFFISKFVNVTEVTSRVSEEADENSIDCDFRDPSWKGSSLFWFCCSWIWSSMWYNQARLNIIATTIGSWHWHPERKPTVVQAFALPFTKSFGTVSCASLIVAIVDIIRRNTKFRCWKLFSPIHLILCLIGCIILTCVNMLTKFTTILHSFTGDSFFVSAKSCYHIMSRHFTNGIVTEVASQNVMTLGAFVFSFALTMTSWAWLDGELGTKTLVEINADGTFIVFCICQAIMLWYPSLAMLFIVMIEPSFKGNATAIVILSVMFIGVTSMMFFTYMGGVILDTIDVCFVCFAVDKDNGVDLAESDFAQNMVKHIPELKEMVPGVELTNQGVNQGTAAVTPGLPMGQQQQQQPQVMLMQQPDGSTIQVIQVQQPDGSIGYMPVQQMQQMPVQQQPMQQQLPVGQPVSMSMSK